MMITIGSGIFEIRPKRQKRRNEDDPNEFVPEGKATAKVCNWCFCLPHRRPLSGCPGCDEPFGPESIEVYTGLQSTHAPWNELEPLVWNNRK